MSLIETQDPRVVAMSAVLPARMGYVMTDPEPPGQSLPTAAVPAAPELPVSAHDAATDNYPATAQAPAAVAPRGRRRWPLVTLVAVIVVAALAGGLVVWAPWKQPPVLRPAGLAVGPATANSISFRWARPATGPLPDKYLILSDDRVAGSVAGTAASYRQAGLTPASTYRYRVVAVRGGQRSPQSAALAVSTLTPPVSQARLQGLWNVFVKNVQHPPGSRNGTAYWDLIPACAAGACKNVVAHVKDGGHSFKMTLTRVGAVYRGHAVVNLDPCGPRGNSIPDPATLKFRVHPTDAVGEGQVWVATSLRGTMWWAFKYVSSATYYCRAASYKATLSGTPG
jgi:Fibronectin type III domain